MSEDTSRALKELIEDFEKTRQSYFEITEKTEDENLQKGFFALSDSFRLLTDHYHKRERYMSLELWERHLQKREEDFRLRQEEYDLLLQELTD